MKTTIRLTESAVMLAAAFVLSLIPVVNMPFGGSVTLCSMLPILLIAYRHGPKWGLLVGFAGACLQLLSGLNNLSYATSAGAAVAIVMLDYIVAFAVLGLGGMFRRLPLSQTTSLSLGTLVCCLVRYLCHVISGCTVWAGVSIPDAQGLIYSLAYNAAYMVPETIITLAAAVAISEMLDIRSDRLRPVKQKQSIPSLIAVLVTVIATAVAAVLLFGAMQTEEGFDITAVSGGDMAGVGVAAGLAVLGAVAAALTKTRTKEE